MSNLKTSVENNKWVYRPADKEAEDDCQAPDFQEVLSAPSGAHFQFSDERKWSKELDEEVFTSKSLFTLDVPMIMDNIAKLPFYMRADIDRIMFTESEIIRMDEGYRQLASQPDFSTENVKPLTSSTPAKESNSCQVTHLSRQVDVTEQSTQAIRITANTPAKTQSIQHTLSQRPSNVGPTSVPDQRLPNQIPSNPHSSNPGSTKKTDDLQDWLDDMINDKA